MKQVKTDQATLPVTTIRNDTLREARCRECDFHNETKYASSAGARHVAKTGHVVRYVTSRVALIVKRAVEGALS